MIILTNSKRRKLQDLWFIFGNNGEKHTFGNHKFIQGLLERGEDNRDFYRRPGRVKEWKPLTEECTTEVDKILNETINP